MAIYPYAWEPVEARRCYVRALAVGDAGECTREVAREIVQRELGRTIKSVRDPWRSWANVMEQIEGVREFAAAQGLEGLDLGDLERTANSVAASRDFERRRTAMPPGTGGAEQRILSQVDECGLRVGRSWQSPLGQALLDGVWTSAHVELLQRYWDSPAFTRIIKYDGSRREWAVETVGTSVQELARALNNEQPTTKEELAELLR